MTKVEIDKKLFIKIKKIFKNDSMKIIKIFKSLEKYPNKGKLLFKAKGIELKELKYDTFRFYFTKENDKIVVFGDRNYQEELITFLDLSKKNNQQDIIDKLKLFIKKRNS